MRAPRCNSALTDAAAEVQRPCAWRCGAARPSRSHVPGGAGRGGTAQPCSADAPILRVVLRA
eukprot:82319-Chlamydomonas_euryale.AAC.2